MEIVFSVRESVHRHHKAAQGEEFMYKVITSKGNAYNVYDCGTECAAVYLLVKGANPCHIPGLSNPFEHTRTLVCHSELDTYLNAN